MVRRPTLDKLEPKRVCLIKPSALGDVIQTLPVLSGLRQRWPDARISWVVNHSIAGLLEGHPDLDEIISFRRHGSTAARLRSMWRLGRQLRHGNFDVAMDLQGLLRSALMMGATRAPRRVGFADTREGAGLVYTDRVVAERTTTNAVLRNWKMAEAFGCGGEPPVPRLGLNDAHLNWAFEKVRQLPRPLLIIHPGAKWQTKRWPPEHFTELARRAQAEFSTSIALIGGAGEVALCHNILDSLPGTTCVNLAGQTPLLNLAALLAQGDVYLSGDSGPMHLAAAVGTPVVGVFTCTSPARSGPFGEGHRVSLTEVPCAGSYLKKCSSMICMDELTPDRVWPALRTALQEAETKLISKSA